jgi:hypothetical protein
MIETPYYPLVPKDPVGNLEFREECVRLGQDPKHAARLVYMCSEDILFYINVFCWTFDPRVQGCPVVPFNTYGFQDETLLELVDAVQSGDDVGIRKSRDMGVSWLICTTFEWFQHFRKDLVFYLVSRKEDLVDKPGDMGALFQKIDFIHKYQPAWLLPRYERKKLHLANLDNGSCIEGDSTGGDSLRGVRATAVLLDEFAAVENGYDMLAATRDVTKCRIFNSSVQTAVDAFYEITEKTKRKIRLHWTRHPLKNKDVKYDGQGKPYNDWYLAELARCIDPREAARELDMDPLASDSVFFLPALLDKVRSEDIRPAFLVGELLHNDAGVPDKFVEDPNGRLKLWLKLDANEKPPVDVHYGAGVDVATGSRDMDGQGYSNSVIVIVNGTTGEKVGEFATSGIEPQDLARYAVALCRWFGGLDGSGAHLLWEVNGPGGLFTNVVMDLGYRNVWFRRDESTTKYSMSYKMGWCSTRATKRTLLDGFKASLAGQTYVERSIEALNEYRMYVYLANGGVAHRRSESTDDPTGARENHGDRLIASALASKAAGERKVRDQEEKDKTPPHNSVGYRHEQREKKEREEVGTW